MTTVITETRDPDVTIEDRAGVYLLTPVTSAGRLWLESEGRAREWAWEAGAVAVRGLPDAWPIVNAAYAAGLMMGETLEPTGRVQRTVDGEWLH